MSLEIKFSSLQAVSFIPEPGPLPALLAQLKKRLGPAPGVYAHEPAILDLSQWTAEDIQNHGLSLAQFAAVFKAAQVNWVAVRSPLKVLEDEAEALGLRLEASSDNAEPEQDNPASTEPASEEAGPSPATEEQASPSASEEVPAASARKTLIIDQSVRSGQKVYAQGADLIVTGQVSAGAEVIADGNVHVYGVLRGRALAGAGGDTNARIYSTCFEAELVAVAGYYLTFEGGFPQESRSKPTMIVLDQNQEPAVLRLKAINIR